MLDNGGEGIITLHLACIGRRDAMRHIIRSRSSVDFMSRGPDLGPMSGQRRGAGA